MGTLDILRNTYIRLEGKIAILISVKLLNRLQSSLGKLTKMRIAKREAGLSDDKVKDYDKYIEG
jgi:hypothetical protein